MDGTPAIAGNDQQDGTTLDGMTTHKKNLRHAGASARNRNYPWPLLLIAAPAAVAIWSGWVGLGSMCGFGPVNLAPGIGSGFHLNTAITLPVGIESYGAYALYAWLALKGAGEATRTFARRSAVGALVLGCLGQVAYHLLAAADWTEAPWLVTVGVACLPVVTLYFAATLTHLILADRRAEVESAEVMAEAATMDLTVAPETASEVTADMPAVVTPEVIPEITPAVTTGDATEVTPEVAPAITPEAMPDMLTKRRRVVPAKATDDELAELVLHLFEDGSEVTRYKVVKAIREAAGGKAGIGDKRAGNVLELARRKRVVPIGERMRA